jgi:hypothetical protein
MRFVQRAKAPCFNCEHLTNSLVGNEGSKMTAKSKKILKKIIFAGIVGLDVNRRSKEMKKLLAVLIVLGLCGTASATLSFIDGGKTIITPPGGVVHLNIVTNSPLYFLDVIAGIDGEAIITGAMHISDCVNYGWDPTLSFDPVGLGTKEVELGAGALTANVGPEVAYIQVTYGSGVVVVSGCDASYWPPVPFPDFVTIIPEPATLLLLGLGAVLLIRKR